VLQIPVNEKKGLTFATGLRSILRHDPDKIMVGEIRDRETAQIAVQAALTGHQVFTTVHANNVFDVLGRFSNMGVDAYSLVASLNGIMAQRLLRTLCPHCARADTVSAAALGPDEDLSESVSVLRAVGCPQCRGTGYKGRVAIAEVLDLDDALKELLASQAPVSHLKEAAARKGFRSLRQAAAQMVRARLTSVEEIDRMTSPT
jgi:general secretion pathway protein E